ncbi:MAG: histidine kinase N-terminal 7TM domain-containing protein [Candidatus Pacebacteria bacterium]|nr:histidine kinase N-terminal 7TM domain-containing protein [Candidatus Paceibacterota bacterium]
MEINIFVKATLVAINVLAVFLGALVYFQDRKSKLFQIFGVVSLLSLLWINFAYIPRIIGRENLEISLLIFRVAWFVTPLFFASLYFLVLYILKKNKDYKLLSRVVFYSSLLASFIAGFSDLVVKNIQFTDLYMTIDYGKAILLFLGLIFFLIISTLFILLKEYFKSDSSLRLKLYYFLIGISIFFLANIVFNIVFPIIYNITHFYWIGDYSIGFFLLFASYAIVKRELLNVKALLTQILIGIFAIFLIIQLFLSETLLSRLWSFLLVAVFAYFGYHMTKDIKREIEDKKKIEELGKKLLNKEKALSKTFTQIAEERARRLYKTTLDSSSKDREIFELKMRIRELKERR